MAFGLRSIGTHSNISTAVAQSRFSILDVLDRLEEFYGPQEPSFPTEPYEFLVWWYCGYPASDAACSKGWANLIREVGIEPEKLLKAKPAKLSAALKAGGMVPEIRAERLKELAMRVQDEFVTLDRSSRVRWAMVTRADVQLDGPGRATLKQGNKTLAFRVREPADVVLAIYPTDPPPAPTDARNEGTRMIGFEVRPAAKQAQRLVIDLIPGDGSARESGVTPLAGW